VHKEKHLLKKPASYWSIASAVAIALAFGTACLYTFSQIRSRPQSRALVPSQTAAVRNDVGALGRIEPQGEVIYLSAPQALQGARVTRLLVRKGDRVRVGQVLAIPDSNATRLAALQQAKTQVAVARARLAQVTVGAKTADIAAQQAIIANLSAELRGQIAAQAATIARLEDQLRNAQTENQRYQQLYSNGAISASDADTRRLSVDTIQQQLNEAKATLNRTVETNQKQQSEAKAKLESIAEVRPTDVQAAQAEVDSAEAAVQQAEAELELTYIRAPIDSQILKIHTWPGEIVSNQGIAELGQTDQMYVVAEVYETDVGKVHLGQSATITSEAFPGKLQGKVTEIGLQVSQQNIFNVNPTADTDRKVVEVKIRLADTADSQRVRNLTNLQVQVLMHV